jgi:hypothetical protein
MTGSRSTPGGEHERFDAFIHFRQPSAVQKEQDKEPDNPTVLVLEVARGKKEQMQYLHQVLPTAEAFGRRCFNGSGSHLLLVDEEGNYDASIGVLMLLLARFFDEDGNESPAQSSTPGT